TTSDVLAALERRPCALVLDLDAPGLDGRVICAAAVAAGATRVLVSTGAPERAPALIRAGCHAILLKPFAPNLLASRLGRLIRPRSTHPARRPAAGEGGTHRRWPGVACPRCGCGTATGFEFTS